MPAGVTLWIRSSDPESGNAQSFLRQHGYAADQVLDLAKRPVTGDDLDRMSNGFGGDLWPLVDTRHPRYGEVLPRGAEDTDAASLRLLLIEHPELVRAPILLTPKGAVAGFREQRWRSFLSIR